MTCRCRNGSSTALLNHTTSNLFDSSLVAHQQILNCTSSSLFNYTCGLAAGPTPQWTLIPVCLLALTVAGVPLNTWALFRLFQKRAVRTPYQRNVIHLLAVNCLASITQNVFGIITTLFQSNRQFIFGYRTCDLYVFCTLILNAASINTHGLMAVNRTCAILFPYSYRRLLTPRLTHQLIFGLWVYVLLAEFPIWLLDTLFYRLPLEQNICIFNVAGQPVYSAVSAIVVFMLPIVTLWLAFFVVFLHKLTRASRFGGHRGQARKSNKVAVAVLKVDDPINLPALGVPSSHRVPYGVNVTAAKRSHGNAYVVLSLLTLSVTACCGPRIMFSVLRAFIPSLPATPAFLQVTIVLFSCPIVLDPILFMLNLE
ncbi:hypothetical protein BV898_16373 [Hypsibius exemplaris]|uniref:G-protein coupled receptors family 1 profile domain-containing protein n=1 Tax=Hypsibius exemplaris TaxID=2072580 RepID=A0A9X6NF62_HYPEX|nr:hypothetical protein BV898_16373 [Hypsibius exemplaris]